MKVTAKPVAAIGKVIQKEGSRKVGSYTCPIWMVQLILEKLLNCTPLSAISPNISSQAALAVPGVRVIVKELTIINFIRSCRKFFRIIGETFAAYRIGKVEQCDKLLSDGTGRRQTYLHNLFIGVINEECLRPLILPTSIVLKGDTSDQ